MEGKTASSVSPNCTDSMFFTVTQFFVCFFKASFIKNVIDEVVKINFITSQHLSVYTVYFCGEMGSMHKALVLHAVV